jgi:hypothetical protein
MSHYVILLLIHEHTFYEFPDDWTSWFCLLRGPEFWTSPSSKQNVFLFLNKVRALIFIKIEKDLQPKIYTGLDMGTNPVRKEGEALN